MQKIIKESMLMSLNFKQCEENIKNIRPQPKPTKRKENYALLGLNWTFMTIMDKTQQHRVVSRLSTVISVHIDY